MKPAFVLHILCSRPKPALGSHDQAIGYNGNVQVGHGSGDIQPHVRDQGCRNIRCDRETPNHAFNSCP